MKLISMTDFVLKQDKFLDITNKQKLILIINYGQFLKQPLELWMFVPCDENDNSMIEPNENMAHLGYEKQYQQAKERCLFEGFEKSLDYIQNSNKCFVVVAFKISIGLGFKNGMHQTIEDLTKYNLQLTQTAIKKFQLIP
jgi:hypothetical protein